MHDMDIDTENVRDTTEEALAGVAQEESLDYNESSRDQQNTFRHREDPASDDMLVKPQMSEDIRRAQEEDTVSETICTIVQKLVDSHESSGDKLHKDGHRDNSESEMETSREKMRHDGSLLSECGSPEAPRGIEEQPSGATRVDGEKGIEEQPSGATRVDGEREIPEMSTLEESEPGSVTSSRDLPEGVEKCRGHNEVEMMDFEMLHGSRKEQSETSEVNVNGSEKGFLSELSVSVDSSKGFKTTDTPVAVTPKAPLRLKISGGAHFFEYELQKIYLVIF